MGFFKNHRYWNTRISRREHLRERVKGIVWAIPILVIGLFIIAVVFDRAIFFESPLFIGLSILIIVMWIGIRHIGKRI